MMLTKRNNVRTIINALNAPRARRRPTSVAPRLLRERERAMSIQIDGSLIKRPWIYSSSAVAGYTPVSHVDSWYGIGMGRGPDRT